MPMSQAGVCWQMHTALPSWQRGLCHITQLILHWKSDRRIISRKILTLNDAGDAIQLSFSHSNCSQGRLVQFLWCLKVHHRASFTLELLVCPLTFWGWSWWVLGRLLWWVEDDSGALSVSSCDDFWRWFWWVMSKLLWWLLRVILVGYYQQALVMTFEGYFHELSANSCDAFYDVLDCGLKAYATIHK